MRFINEVALSHKGDDCVPWPFGRNADGYGKLWLKDKMLYAHRYICELAHGAPPTEKHEAAHSCGRGKDGCINPNHLEWKTRVANQADRLEHGTHNRGGRSWKAQLSEEQAREILSFKGKEPQRTLAERFGVSRQTVSNIHNGHVWAWLT
ncbi:hypothetical protein ATY75_26840 [Rhizobium sp. N122]|uniref:HNH endonuclease n=1 Tax=Rhizobium sp. N122 TaxID=1764272 RepID=UPI000B5A91E0|nr:HNH endonuclease [Rhizobium sp. N122]OWV83020.1 hypothetical protein ATY75_26840 [Rhizobium sp. N122]